MKRGGFLGLAALVLTCMGVLAAAILAGPVPAVVGTTTAPTTTTAPPELIPAGVSVGGVPVGYMNADDAYQAVNGAFERPLLLLVGRSRLSPLAEQLGATARIRQAVERARTVDPGTSVPLVVNVDGTRLRTYVALLARRFDRAAADAKLYLRGLRPWISRDRAGRTLERAKAVRTIVLALVANRRGAVRLSLKALKPTLTKRNFGPVVVIRRGSNHLYYYEATRLGHVFGVATGQSVYPTPLGRFSVAVKWRNPWWYPPNSPWARGQKPIPPGPGNPLGTRWMGLSAAGVGIHGTPDDASIGYSVSHGCIRMHISDAEWLFVHIRVGTPVFIVAA